MERGELYTENVFLIELKSDFDGARSVRTVLARREEAEGWSACNDEQGSQRGSCNSAASQTYPNGEARKGRKALT
jgi:hypothetical protein